MVTLVIKNVDKNLLVKQVKDLYDLAYRERMKAKSDVDETRITRAASLDALLDMLTDAEVING